MVHLIHLICLSISFAKIGLKCTDRPQMYESASNVRIGLKCTETESASNVQIGLKCTNRPQMYELASNVQRQILAKLIYR